MQLLLETATDVCSVAVADTDGRMLSEITADEVFQHASHLTVFIHRAMRAAGASMDGLDRIILSDGPGSYTSLRVGAATAKGIIVARPRVQLYTVDTLAALATTVHAGAEERILATINSRRGEVYGRIFATGDGITPLTDVMNIRLTDPRWRGKLMNGAGLGRVVVCGPGRKRLMEALPEEDNAFRSGGTHRAHASYLGMAPARRRPDVAAYEPMYLNPPFVTQSKKRSLL